MAKSKRNPMKDQVATVFTHTYTYYIHSDGSWGRFKKYKVDIKGQNIPEGKALVRLGDTWKDGIIFNSLSEAFVYLRVDPTIEPDFDLKSLRAWAAYILD